MQSHGLLFYSVARWLMSHWVSEWVNVCSMSFTTATASSSSSSSSSFLCIYPLFLKKENKKCFLFFSCLGCNGGRHRGPNSYRLLGCIFIGYCCVCAARLHLCHRLSITEHSFFFMSVYLYLHLLGGQFPAPFFLSFFCCCPTPHCAVSLFASLLL